MRQRRERWTWDALSQRLPALPRMRGALEDALSAIWRMRAARVAIQIALVGVVLVIAAFTLYHRFLPQGAAASTNDFYSYYQSALALRQGASPYSSLAGCIRSSVCGGQADPSAGTVFPAGVLEFAYTPFFGLLLIPFTWLPFNVALTLWDGCNLLLLGAAIYAFLRAARVTPGPIHLLLLTVAAMLTSPLRFDLYWAQADLVLLCFICAALWARCAGRPVLAGLLLAAACACEPALLALAPLLLWKREIKLAVVTLAGSVALIFAPFLWLGGAALKDLLVIWRFYWGAHAVVFTNDAPMGILLRLLTPNPYVTPLAVAPWFATALWLLIALLVLLIAAMRIAPRPLGSDDRSLLDVGLACAALLLASPFSENNHFTLLLLPFLAIYVYLRRGGWRSADMRPLLWGFAGALLLLYVAGDTIQIALVARMGLRSPIVYMEVLLAATYLYTLLAISGVVLMAQRLLGTPVARQQAVAQERVTVKTW